MRGIPKTSASITVAREAKKGDSVATKCLRCGRGVLVVSGSRWYYDVVAQINDHLPVKLGRCRALLRSIVRDVVLSGIEVRRCSSCGEKETAIPRLSALQRAIARDQRVTFWQRDGKRWRRETAAEAGQRRAWEDRMDCEADARAMRENEETGTILLEKLDKGLIARPREA